MGMTPRIRRTRSIHPLFLHTDAHGDFQDGTAGAVVGGDLVHDPECFVLISGQVAAPGCPPPSYTIGDLRRRSSWCRRSYTTRSNVYACVARMAGHTGMIQVLTA